MSTPVERAAITVATVTVAAVWISGCALVVSVLLNGCAPNDPPPAAVTQDLMGEEDCLRHIEAGPLREQCRHAARAIVCSYWDADTHCTVDR